MKARHIQKTINKIDQCGWNKMRNEETADKKVEESDEGQTGMAL